MFDTYDTHDRITPGSLDTHLDRIAYDWLTAHHHGQTIAITATTNAHVDRINARHPGRPPRRR